MIAIVEMELLNHILSVPLEKKIICGRFVVFFFLFVFFKKTDLIIRRKWKAKKGTCYLYHLKFFLNDKTDTSKENKIP